MNEIGELGFRSKRDSFLRTVQRVLNSPGGRKIGAISIGVSGGDYCLRATAAAAGKPPAHVGMAAESSMVGALEVAAGGVTDRAPPTDAEEDE